MSINRIWMELVAETNFSNTVQVFQIRITSKLYKRGNFGLCKFSLQNLHIVWNFRCKRMFHRGQELYRPLEKCYFCVFYAEETMFYSLVYLQDNNSVANISPNTMRLRRDGYCPCLSLFEMKQELSFKRVLLICTLCLRKLQSMP